MFGEALKRGVMPQMMGMPQMPQAPMQMDPFGQMNNTGMLSRALMGGMQWGRI